MGTHLQRLKSNLQKLSQTKHNSPWDVADLRSISKPLTLHTTGCYQRPVAFSASDPMPAHTSSESASHSPSSSETDSTTGPYRKRVPEDHDGQDGQGRRQGPN